MRYQYWIIRFVPNLARGEFTNIGIVSGRDDGDWSVAFETHGVRNHGALSTDLRELGHWIDWFQRTLQQRDAAAEPVGSAWIARLRSRQASSVQLSEPAPIDAASAADAVALLFPHLVERTTPRRRQALTRKSMRADVRDALVHEGGLMLGVDLLLQPRVRIGKQRGTFDLLRADAPDAALTNVWAFNVATLDNLEREIQSWNYLVRRLRDDGATRLDRDRTVELPAGTPIDVIYDAPAVEHEQQWRGDIFDAAKEAWELNGIRARSLDDFRAELDALSSAARA